MNRTELIHYLCNDNVENAKFISKSLRGNTLWTIWKREDIYFIVMFHLKREENGWTYDREDESTPPSKYTCPRNYLTMANIICEDWREKVEKYVDSKKEIKSHIRDLYKKRKKGEILQVKLTAKEHHVIRLHDYALKDAILNIVSVYPGIEGRFPKNGLRYAIPLRLVSDVILTEKENEKNGEHYQIAQPTDGRT